MKTWAALLRQAPADWSVEEVELNEPRTGEVLVEMVAAGLCHSDEHQRRGDVRVSARKVCRSAATTGSPSWKGCSRTVPAGVHSKDGQDVATHAMLGTFSEWQVYDQNSLVRIEKDIPLEVACLVSCGVQTGFGSATAGNVQPGDVVIAAGVGGVGMNAVQGVHACGASHVIAVDPVPEKRKWALDFGATEAFESIAAAMDRVHELTNWQGADVTILTAGVVDNSLIGEGYQSIRKGGTLVVTGIGRDADSEVVPGLNAFKLAMFEKRIQGALYGRKAPREAMPSLLGMYRAGTLKLDELITKFYRLDEINDAYADLHAGRNIRGVIRFGQ